MAAGQDQAQLWHGGAPGRRTGDWLLCPRESGISSAVLQMTLEAGLSEIGQRDDRVYVTTDRELARAWAGVWTPDGVHHGGGSLYRVEATDLEPDDDLLSLPGLSYQAPRAQVLAVYDAHVAYKPKFAATLQRVLDDLAFAKLHSADRERTAPDDA